MPRIRRSGPAGGGAGSPESFISTGPVIACPIPTGGSITPNPNADGEMLMTRDANTRIIGVTRANVGMMRFINSQTNTVITDTACDIEWDFDGGDGAGFATSTHTFFMTGTSGVLVFDTSGNVITEIAPPANSFFVTNYCYDPTLDKIYGIAANNSDHKIHIIEIDPHTNTISNNVATPYSAATTPGIFRLPGRVALLNTNALDFHTLPTLARENEYFAPGLGGETDYVPATGLVYVRNGSDVSSIDPATATIVDTIVAQTNFFQKQYFKYNPITGLIIAGATNGEITAIDPVAKTIICEFTLAANTLSSIAVDYSSGDVYFLTRDFSNNPILAYH